MISELSPEFTAELELIYKVNLKEPEPYTLLEFELVIA